MVVSWNLRKRLSPGHSSGKRPRRFRASFEQLEDRTVPSTFIVNTTADTTDVNPGDGLAQDAFGNTSLRAAVMEANALAGPDTIQLPAGLFQLTRGGAFENGAVTGDLDIRDDLTIIGSTSGTSEISAKNLGDRIFDLPIGAGLNAQRVVNLSNLTLSNGVAPGTGTSPSLEDNGGAIRIDFFNNVTITNVTFANNSAPHTSGNQVYGLGGAIDNNGFLTINSCRFANNSASNGGGAIYGDGSPGSIAISNSSFTDNTAVLSGGAIFNHQPLTIDNSTLARNKAVANAGVGQGGAIDNNGGGNLKLTNCTISDNTAIYGGGISNFQTLTVNACTFAGNSAAYGGGIYASSAIPGSIVSLANTIVALNTATGSGPDINGTASSQGHNLIGNNSGANGLIGSDLVNVNPQLGTLANNGGPTQTRALLAGSPAIDAANTATAPATDQRGVSRPQGSQSDIGAYELVVDHAPVAADDSYTTDEDTALTVNTPGVLGNDTDVDGDPLTAVLVAGPAHGSLVLNSDGSFKYTPSANYNGSDSFTYKANDGQLDSNVATVKITINPVNDAPVAANDSDTTDEDTALTVNAPGVLGNDTDVDGDPLMAVLVAGPAHGTLALNSDGSFKYTPSANYNGADSFTYKANDGQLNSNVATVKITINPVNDAPVAANDSYTTDEDTALSVNAPGVLGNDTDVDGDPLTAVLVAGPAHGTLALNSDGSFKYTPSANYNGADSFTYKANDGQLDSNVATVKITINPVNDAPVAANDSYTTDEDTALTVNTPGVLGNDTDVDGDPLTAVLVAGPAHGSLALNSDGSFKYTPAANYNGADSFTYKANDGQLDSNVATVKITINPVNDAPVAADDSYSTDEDTMLTVNAPGVLGNDTDVDGDSLTAVLVAGPAHGTLALNSDGSFKYTPAANYNGADSFTYKANDGQLDSNIATVKITINPVNDAPVAANDSYTTDEDTALTVNTPGVLGNDTDVDGDPLTAVLGAGPAHGTLALNSDGSFKYTPAANYNGADSFTYKASDGLLNSNTATVKITINPVNDAPVAVADSYSTTQGVILNVPAQGVLSNDTDVDGDALSAILVGGPSQGSLTLNANGSFSYVPNPGFSGMDSFTYKANDGLADSNVATVKINVTPAPSTEGKITGSGSLDGGRRHFNININSHQQQGAFAFSGDLNFSDDEHGITLLSTAVTSFSISSDGIVGIISGRARVNGRDGYSFTVILEDHGEPGAGVDKFRILIAGPGLQYDSLDYAVAAGILERGNIQIHRH
jgi:CSLREA domain-containing protein